MDTGFEEVLGVGQAAEFGVGRHDVLGEVLLPNPAPVVPVLGGEQAWAVEVEEGRQGGLREAVDLGREAPRDVVVAEPLADHIGVLALDQRVVVGMPGPGLGEPPDAQLLEERGDPVVDVFAAVVGVEAEDRERKGQQQPLEQRDQEALRDTRHRTDELELGDLVHQIDQIHALFAVPSRLTGKLGRTTRDVAEKRISMHIPPWSILAGFGSLSRRELSDLLAVFEDTNLFNVVTSRVRDLADRRSAGERGDTDVAFRQRVEETSRKVLQSDHSDAVLRLQLWHKTRVAFGLEAAIPLATRTANLRAADVAQHAADQLRDSIIQGAEQISWSDLPDRIWSNVGEFFSSRGHADFSEIVGAQASRMLAEAAQDGLLDDATRDALLKRVREQLRDVPPELRDQSVEQALKAGDATALTVLTGGTSLVGLGVAVELAGFGAYTLAAQASAILPLIGGKAAVSGLAVLANPFFIVPAIIGGGALANRQFQRSARTKLASSLVIQMALKGLSTGSTGLAACLDDFKSLTARDIQATGIGTAQSYNRKIDVIRDLLGNPLPETPGRPPKALDKLPTGRTLDGLGQVLFPERQGVASEALTVGGFTIADIVYHAAAIKPEVVRAADFSRSEDLSGIFEFGVFADRVGNLSGNTLVGTESHLQGYVAEQLVATRLLEQGHQVEFAPASNTAGWDLTVDGERFQVKCLSDLKGLGEHFKDYPDIPVLANAELVEQIRELEPVPDWADKVHSVEGFDLETVETIMQQSLEHGAALNDLNVPVFAVAVSAAKNIHAWWKGSLSLADLPFEVAVDGVVKGGLTVAGGFVGQSIGLLLFGPAGAVVFGAFGGTGALFGSGWAREKLDHVLIAPEWVRRLDEPTEDFRVSLKAVMRRKIEILKGKIDQLDSLDGELVPWIRGRLSDSALAIAEGVAELEFDVVEQDQPKRAIELLRLMRDTGVHSWSVQSKLVRLAESLTEKPTVGGVARSRLDRTRSALAEVVRPKRREN